MPVEPPPIPGLSFEERIGESAGAVVWLAHQEALDRRVAVKVLDSDSPESINLFERERVALGRLSQHRSIVTIYQSGIIGGHPYLVLQYADQGSLADRIKASPIGQQQAHTVAIAIATALEHVHRASMTHGDVKPSNVLIDSHAGPLLADLGLSRFENAVDQIGYTPAYAAPELLKGQPSTLASDMYAFGVLLHEMLSGRIPFDPQHHRTLIGFARQVASEPPPDLRPEATTPVLAELVRQLLAKQPDLRPPASEVLNALQDQPDTIRVAPAGRGRGRSSRRRSSRRRMHWARIAVGVVAMLLLLLFVAVFGSLRTPEPEDNEVFAPSNEPDSVDISSSSVPVSATATTAVLPTSTSLTLEVSPPEVEVPKAWRWSYANEDPLRWVATTEDGGFVIDVVSLRGLTPMAPNVSGDDVWVSAIDENMSDGKLFTMEVNGIPLTEYSVTPSDRPFVSGATGLVPTVDPESGSGVLVSYSDDVGANVVLDLNGLREGLVTSVVYVAPDPAEWSVPVIAFSLTKDDGGLDFSIDSVLAGAQDPIAERVFPNGVGVYGQPGSLLSIAGPNGDHFYSAERSSAPFEGASIFRWPKIDSGPPNPLPIDANSSGTLQDVIHLAPDGTLWLVSRGRIVTRFDLEKDLVTGVVSAGPCPIVDELVGCEFLSEDGSQGAIAFGAFWIGNAVDGLLYRIDLDTVEITDVIDVGGTPGTPAATGSAVWVADLDTATVVRIDPETRVVTDRIDLPCFDSAEAPDGLDSPTPVLTDCEPWPRGLDWRFRPIASEEGVWVPWDGMLFKIHEQGADATNGNDG